MAIDVRLFRGLALLVFTLRLFAGRGAKLSTKDALALLGIRPEAQASGRLLLKAKTTVQVLAGVPVSKCKQNTFFLDWGSSGMKVHAVHAGFSSNPKKIHEVKFVGLGPQASESHLVEVLGNLSSKLTSGHAGGGVIATAGFRLMPLRAGRAWERVKRWNVLHKLFTKCSPTESGGCRTLPGSDEADYEMQGMVDELRAHGKSTGNRYGMASCGGASIQLGFWGLSEVNLRNCVLALNHFSTHYDQARTKLGVVRQAAWFSFLANHNAPLSISGRSDYDAGGVDEMRARFDSFLEKTEGQAATNPCVSPATDSLHSKGGKCTLMAGQDVPCLKDKWGSYMTRLKGRPGSTREMCRETVQIFLQDDAMLSAWHSNTACRALAAQVPQWNFLTAFSRETQLGADLGGMKTWGEVRRCTKKFGATPTFESPEDIEDRMPGEYLTSALLIGFLQRIGLNASAWIRASKGDVATVAMRHLGLSRGWVSEDSYECESPEASPPSPAGVTQFMTSAKPTTTSPVLHGCLLPPYFQVEQSGAYVTEHGRDFFRTNDTVKVKCRRGFVSILSRKSWTLTCMAHGKWEDAKDVSSMTIATRTSVALTDAGKLPHCKQLHCVVPVDEMGEWQGRNGYNQSLSLVCSDGYQPSGGPASLTCTDGGSFDKFARCKPINSVKAGSWSSRVTASGLTSFGILSLVGIGVFVCVFRPQPSLQSSTQDTSPILPVADQEME